MIKKVHYGNQWVRDSDGEWTEVTKARFTGDDIASRDYRKDYAGGATKEHFFLHNGGFFTGSVKLGSAFERTSTKANRPDIDFDSLEGAR